MSAPSAAQQARRLPQAGTNAAGRACSQASGLIPAARPGLAWPGLVAHGFWRWVPIHAMQMDELFQDVSSQTSRAGHSLGPPALLVLEGRGALHPATLGCSGFNLARSGAVA